MVAFQITCCFTCFFLNSCYNSRFGNKTNLPFFNIKSVWKKAMPKTIYMDMATGKQEMTYQCCRGESPFKYFPTCLSKTFTDVRKCLGPGRCLQIRMFYGARWICIPYEKSRQYLFKSSK